MKLKYDEESDSLYLQLRDKEKDILIDTTVSVHDNFIFDLTKDGEVVGIEILYLKELLFSLLNK